MGRQQILNTKHPGFLENHEKAKYKTNRDRKRTPAQSHRKYIQQNHRRKLSQPKEGHANETTISLQNTNRLIQKKTHQPHNNHDTKHTE